jgi:sugar lactone lactonase YvrE
MNCFPVSGSLRKAVGFEGAGSAAYLRVAPMRLICGLVLSLVAQWAHAQEYTFTTIAGTAGSTGTNDGTGLGAKFDFPVGVVPDRAGNLYVADFLNHAIRKLTPAGNDWVVTTIAGLPGALPGYADGTNTNARFNRPAGIAIDNAGNLFVAERYNHTIRKISPSGTNWVVSTVAGMHGVMGSQNGTNTDAQFYLPSGIAVDNSNHLFVADTANFTIREITPIGTNWVVTTIAGTALNFGLQDGINGAAQFNYPYGITFGSNGKLYVADSGNNAIREMTYSAGEWGVATIAGSTNRGSADGAGGSATFYFPTGVAVDNGGALYVADQSNNSIRKIVPGAAQWMVSTLAGQPLHPGSVDDTGTNALFKKPWGIAVDALGTLFVADYGNSTIRQGTLESAPAPELRIFLSANQVVLTWPASASNYVLETSPVLNETNAWVPITNGISVSGENLVLTNQVDTASGFYRLHY